MVGFLALARLGQHPSLTRANANAVAAVTVAAACIDASALRSQYPRGADQENLPLMLSSPSVRQGRKRSPPAV